MNVRFLILSVNFTYKYAELLDIWEKLRKVDYKSLIMLITRQIKIQNHNSSTGSWQSVNCIIKYCERERYGANYELCNKSAEHEQVI